MFSKKSKLNQIFITAIIVSLFVSLVGGFIGGAVGVSFFKQKNTEKIIKEEVKQISLTRNDAVVDVVEKSAPAVVSVIISKDLPIVEQYYANPFGDSFPFKLQIPQFRQKGTEKKEVGGGTGFIVSSNGLIITNKHVVVDKDAEYTVLTNDEKKYKAKVLARDPIQDLAVLKIEAENMPVLPLGDSANIKIGQTVVAIGNALGEFRNTVSVGVISGLSRTITASGGGFSEELKDIIQTDAAINQGNSGGPLLNLHGEVIGINTAIVSGAQNIGFAIPINTAKKDIEDVKRVGKIIYPFLGVQYILINDSVKRELGLEVNYGALIIKGENNEPAIVPGSGAEKAGLREDDIILELDGEKITSDKTLAELIQSHKVGDTVNLKILRDNKEMRVKATLGER